MVNRATARCLESWWLGPVSSPAAPGPSWSRSNRRKSGGYGFPAMMGPVGCADHVLAWSMAKSAWGCPRPTRRLRGGAGRCAACRRWSPAAGRRGLVDEHLCCQPAPPRQSPNDPRLRSLPSHIRPIFGGYYDYPVMTDATHPLHRLSALPDIRDPEACPGRGRPGRHVPPSGLGKASGSASPSNS